MSPIRKAVLLLLRAYQLSLSSVFGRQCRFLPTCSDYTAEAVALHGVWRGGMLGAARVCRCHPWGGSGYDPVPRSLPARSRRRRRQDRASSSADRP